MKINRLADKQIKYLIRQKQKGTSTSQIAQEVGVTRRHVRRVWKRFCDLDERDVASITSRTVGRPKTNSPTQQDIDAVLDIHNVESAGSGVIRTKKEIERTGYNISYYTVYNVMKNEGLVIPSAAKSRRRKWIRYERVYSNAMWHVDWHAMKDPRLKRLQLVAYLDDASRCITGFGLYSEATSINAVIVLRMAIQQFGKPATILSDNGKHFVTMRNSLPQKRWKPTVFENELLEHGIGLINARPYHPQTNGKFERFFRTLETELVHKDDLQKYIDYYNERRLHFSLDIDNYETPLLTFRKKKATNVIRKDNPKWMEEDINDRRT